MSSCKTFTIDDVAKHNQSDDFYVIIDNEVFDLSNFASHHPGGWIINTCAGTDGTVLYHTYHFDRIEMCNKILAPYRIGKFNPSSCLQNDEPSPSMGSFFKEVSLRVTKEMKRLKLNNHPKWALTMLFIDILLSLLLVAISLSGVFSVSSPQVLLSSSNDTASSTSSFLTSCALKSSTLNVVVMVGLCYFHEVTSSRLRSHAHAWGHMQLIGKKRVEQLGYLIHVFCQTSFIYSLPSKQTGNCRKLLNMPRSISQYEYMGRGPYEHQSLHHVKGIDYDHDDCYSVASLNELIKIRETKSPSLNSKRGNNYKRYIGNYLQKYEFGRFLILSFSLFVISPTLIVAKTKNIFTSIFDDQEYLRAFLMLVGVFWNMLQFYCQFHEIIFNPIPLICLFILSYYQGCFWFLFYAQHTWHVDLVSEHTDNSKGISSHKKVSTVGREDDMCKKKKKDSDDTARGETQQNMRSWGEEQVLGCYSLWNEVISPKPSHHSQDDQFKVFNSLRCLSYHPVFLGYGNASSPSTLSYHLEHTLFPGVSYLHLPLIAPIVEETCKDFGLPYNKIVGVGGLKKLFNKQLTQFASS